MAQIRAAALLFIEGMMSEILIGEIYEYDKELLKDLAEKGD